MLNDSKKAFGNIQPWKNLIFKKQQIKDKHNTKDNILNLIFCLFYLKILICENIGYFYSNQKNVKFWKSKNFKIIFEFNIIFKW